MARHRVRRRLLGVSFSAQNGFNPRAVGSLFLPGQLAASTLGWQPFNVPRNASMLYAICVGGGGSGGGGQTSGTGVVGGGGGGVGSGGMGRLLIPTIFLPRTLYLLPGAGGLGVAAATLGNAGARSIISVQPSTSLQTSCQILVSGTAAATGGAAGAASATAGAAETLATNSLTAFSGLGIWTAIAGQIGSASGASGGAGVAVSGGAAGIPVSGGAGGGTTNTTTGDGIGGAVTGQALALVPTVAGGAAAGGRGQDGFNRGQMTFSANLMANLSREIMAFTGGSGGGAAHGGGVGGQGGAGAFGSGGGGGGGGGGTGGGTGGRGGEGGPGFIYLAWW
jgi:hypothetical protein